MLNFDEGVLLVEVCARKYKDVLERGTLLRSRPRSFRGGEVNPFDSHRGGSNSSAQAMLSKRRGREGDSYWRLRNPHLRALTYFFVLPPSKQAVSVHRVARLPKKTTKNKFVKSVTNDHPPKNIAVLTCGRCLEVIKLEKTQFGHH